MEYSFLFSEGSVAVEFNLSWNQPVIVYPTSPVKVPFPEIHMENLTQTVLNSVVVDIDGNSKIQNVIVDTDSIRFVPG